jgi:cell pole-organizing protein PopZ
MPPPGRTLEDLIRELMQPMLKEWLDENLPAIVQARVDEEIERISRRRVR